jgi:hypothetical protein
MDYSLKKTFDMDPRETKTKEGWTHLKTQQIKQLICYKNNKIFPCFALQLAHDFGDLKHIGTHLYNICI